MSLKDVLGQQYAVDILTNELRLQKVKPAYLFYGIKGVGKKFTAIQFVKTLLCEEKKDIFSCDKCSTCQKVDSQTHPDVLIIDFLFQSNLLSKEISEQKVIRIDTVREVQRIANLTSYTGKLKIFIIDQAETMQSEAANSLLKILEEPPKTSLFILISAGLGHLPKTVVSRCELIKFLPLQPEVIKQIFPEIDEEILHYSCGSVENVRYIQKIKEYINTFEDIINLKYEDIKEICSQISKDKELTKYIVHILIEKLIHRIVSKEKSLQKILIEIDEFKNYSSRLVYNIDTNLLLQTFLTHLRLVWNKN